MGLFDELKGVAFQAAEGAAQTLLANAVSNAPAGMQGILGKLEAAGLGDQVQSWLSSGANLPISADQLKAALGDPHLQQIAQSMGLPADQIAEALAEHLPGIAASTAAS